MTPDALGRPQLSERLSAFGGRVWALARTAPKDPVLEGVLRQMARAAMSPAANYAEAREAVSGRDYVHRMKICVKELREALVWLEMAEVAGFKRAAVRPLIAECRELIAICVTCIRRAAGVG